METRPPTFGRIAIAAGFALSCFGLLLFLWLAFGGPIPLKSKSYRVDVAFRFAVDDGRHQRTTVRIVRLVLDRNGIKRMTDLVPETVVSESTSSTGEVPALESSPVTQQVTDRLPATR